MNIRPFKEYTEEFKLSVVRAVESGKSVPDVAEAFGVTAHSVRRWFREYGDESKQDTVIKMRPRPSVEFKMAAVERVAAGEKPDDVAASLGLSRAAVYKWCAKLLQPISAMIGGEKTERERESVEGALADEGGEEETAEGQVSEDSQPGAALPRQPGVCEDAETGAPPREDAQPGAPPPRHAQKRRASGTPDAVPHEPGITPHEPGIAKQKSVALAVKPAKALANIFRPALDTGEAVKRAQARMEEMQREREAEKRKKKEETDLVRLMVADPLLWMQHHTKTKDSHWREAGAESPYRPVPDKPYFRPLTSWFQQEPVLFIEKSRDMMISWLCVGLFTHAAMTNDGIEILFQSQKEEKAKELVEYAKCLYEQQDPEIKKAFPLAKGRKAMIDGELHFANGSRIIGIPGGGDQIRSYHPWGLLQDEASFMPEAGKAYDHAVPVCKKIVVVSSAGPGWFAEQCQNAESIINVKLPQGLTLKYMDDGRLVARVHYSADPERSAAWVTEERKKYSTQGAWDREQEIIHEAGGGERLFADILARYADKILIDPYKGFQIPPMWKRVGGFDHGKANPTGALVGCVDYDGVIYILGEYYQPGMTPAQHRYNLVLLRGFMEAQVYADPSIFYKNQAQSDGKFKAISELYFEQGIENLIPAPDTHELLGMERILAHWHDLDNREPTLKIVCARELRDISRPIYGVHNNGCPNLLWELRRARREELTPAQLVSKNPSEKIVDKDNHLRDALKYLCLAMLEPTAKTPHMKALEAIADIPKTDPSSRMMRYEDALIAEEQKKAPFITLSSRHKWMIFKAQVRRGLIKPKMRLPRY